MKHLNVLIACEESQAECRAFRALGHHAYSCDIQPCRTFPQVAMAIAAQWSEVCVRELNINIKK